MRNEEPYICLWDELSCKILIPKDKEQLLRQTKCPTLPMPLATISKIWGQKSEEMGKLVWTPIGLMLTQKRLGTREDPLGKLGESHVAEAFAGQIESRLGEEWGGKSRQIPQLLRNPLGGGWECNLSSKLGHFWGWSGKCKVIRTSINWANQDMWLPSPISFLGSREGNHQNYDQPQQIFWSKLLVCLEK